MTHTASGCKYCDREMSVTYHKGQRFHWDTKNQMLFPCDARPAGMSSCKTVEERRADYFAQQDKLRDQIANSGDC